MGERVPYQAGEYGPEQRKEKIAAVRLLVGLVVASKHHVRMEYGTDYEDLRAVVPHQLLARFKKQGYGYGAVEYGDLFMSAFLPLAESQHTVPTTLTEPIQV